MIVDLLLLSGAILSIGVGYNKGLFASLFAVIGYFGGGVAALLLVMDYTEGWKVTISLVGLYIIGIFIGAGLGRSILQSLGRSIHKKILFGPFKFLDSLFGGALYLLQFALFSLLVLSVLRFLPFEAISEQIEVSRAFTYFSGASPLSFLTSDLLQSISSHLDLPKS